MLNIFNLLAPKTPLERPKIAVFKLSVAIGGNKVTIEKTLLPPVILLLSATYNKRGKCCNKYEKTCSYALRIFVSQASYQNPIGINTIALVSPWENV